MKKREPFDWVLLALLSIASLWTVAGIVLGVAHIQADAACKDAGYREAQIAWFMEPYCITRHEQTDIVKRLRDVQGNEPR